MRSFLFVILFLLPFSFFNNVTESRGSYFSDVKVQGNNGNYQVSGEVESEKGTFYYSVEDGHEVFIQETKIQTKKLSSGLVTFHIDIQIPESKLPANGTVILYLYERSSDNLITNSYPVVLERKS